MKSPAFVLLTFVSIIYLPFLTCLSWNREIARKGKENMLENWESWAEPYDDCNCDCKDKKTVAIVIPKYKFVDIPVAKEIPSEKIKYTKTVHVKDGSKYEAYDEVDEHNHHILDSMELKREGEESKRRKSTDSN